MSSISQPIRYLSIILLLACAGLAWAHGGATGIVKERMDAMTSLSKSVKKLTPIMRGRTDYNADTVQQEAEKIAKLGSSHLT